MTYSALYAKYYRKKKKYGNKTQVYNGVRYHSVKEANYAEELDWRKKAGEVVKWERQVKIDLRAHGKHICFYHIDFKLWLSSGEIEYVEVKGFETRDWRIKWKLFEAQMGEEEPGAILTVYK